MIISSHVMGNYHKYVEKGKNGSIEKLSWRVCLMQQFRMIDQFTINICLNSLIDI